MLFTSDFFSIDVHCRTFNFRRKIDGMKRTQRMHDGDRSHADLVLLDSLTLNYVKWEDDWHEAEQAHKCLTFQSFDDKLQEIKLKQQIHDGDRSHPRLEELDALQLSYAGYEDDVIVALDQHLSNRSFNFQQKISGMKEKQKIYEGDRTHPNLKLLDALTLT